MGPVAEQAVGGPREALSAAVAGGAAAPANDETALVSAWDDSETPEGMATYVVTRLSPELDGLKRTWADVARVHVPKKSQMKTVLPQALTLAGITPTEADRFRVLDDQAAYSYRVEPVPPVKPEFRVV